MTQEEFVLSTTTAAIDVSRFDERTLLLLGVLMMENQHGYQINDFIENRLCSVISMKKPTAYALLDKLSSIGAIQVQVEQEGSRPPRKVYEITDAGKELFLALLRENLSNSTLPHYSGDIGLMFMNYLDPADVVVHLHNRLEGIEQVLATAPAVPSHGPNLRLDVALDHTRAMREAERDWLVRTIASLEAER